MALVHWLSSWSPRQHNRPPPLSPRALALTLSLASAGDRPLTDDAEHGLVAALRDVLSAGSAAASALCSLLDVPELSILLSLLPTSDAHGAGFVVFGLWLEETSSVLPEKRLWETLASVIRAVSAPRRRAHRLLAAGAYQLQHSRLGGSGGSTRLKGGLQLLLLSSRQVGVDFWLGEEVGSSDPYYAGGGASSSSSSSVVDLLRLLHDSVLPQVLQAIHGATQAAAGVRPDHPSEAQVALVLVTRLVAETLPALLRLPEDSARALLGLYPKVSSLALLAHEEGRGAAESGRPSPLALTEGLILVNKLLVQHHVQRPGTVCDLAGTGFA